MRRLNKYNISNDMGESLVESLTSLLIFSLLMLVITSMLKTSLRITADASLRAVLNQDLANTVILEEYTDESSLDFVLSVTDENPDTGIETVTEFDMSIPVKFSQESFVAFAPVEELLTSE